VETSSANCKGVTSITLGEMEEQQQGDHLDCDEAQAYTFARALPQFPSRFAPPCSTFDDQEVSNTSITAFLKFSWPGVWVEQAGKGRNTTVA